MSQESHDLGPTPTLTTLAGFGDGYVCPGDEVYVVSEDCDYVYLNTGSNPPADGFNIIKAIFLPGVWQRRDSGGGAGALRYNTVAVGALGSGRLIDASLAGLVDGTSLAWVESVKDTWRWDATSTLTADNITVCNPTANGANPGRFIRLLQPAPEWMAIYGGASVSCVIDASNSTLLANDENDGLTATTPLLTDTERQRRMGENPIWTASEYHLRYISDVPSTQEVTIRNRTKPAAQIFLHSSMTNGAGQSTLFSGTAGTITALNYAAAAGGQPWEMICATIPASWTASGLLDKRLRFTSGANLNGVLWIIKDLGGAAPNAKARLNEPQVANAMTAPVAVNASTFTPVAGDTFVVEQLTKIPLLTIDMTGGINNATVNGVILDSIDQSNGGRAVFTGGRSIVRFGCTLNATENQIYSCPGLSDLGCQFASVVVPRPDSWLIANCYSKAVALSLTISVGGTIRRHMCQGNASVRLSSAIGNLTGVNLGWQIEQIGAWDNNASYPFQVFDSITLTATATLWGNGNIGANTAAILLYRGAQIIYGAPSTALPASYFFMTTASAGPENGAFIVTFGNAGSTRPSVAAFDDATQLFTAKRLLSAANLSATVAAGGFGGYFFDPVTACSMGQG